MADSQMHPQLQSRFLSLPDELIIDIVSQLSDDRPALCSLARTCRRMQPLCEEHIYTIIELESTDDLRDILEAFSRRFERIAAVQTLRILYKFHEGLAATLEVRKAFNAYVGEMKGLKDWHVESPYDNYKWNSGGEEWVEQDMEIFRTALEKVSYNGMEQSLQADLGLAKLNKLILHTHGATSDFWDLNGFHCLFRHPSLRYLHVSCVRLPADLPELASCASTTPLTTLIFDECEIEPGGLRHILGTPKSLKHLTLGENVFNSRRERGVVPRLSRAPDAAIQALLPTARSLESLTHYDPMFMTLADPGRPATLILKGDGMRHFHSLKFLECDPCSFLHQGIILAPTLAPPNLETLRIRNPRHQRDSNFFDQLPDFTPYTYLGSIKTLEFINSTSMKSPTHISDAVCESDQLRERHAIAYKLHQHGINMKMYMEIHGSPSLIPPYLHGEATPKTLCLYDAAEIGFLRRVVEDVEAESSQAVDINEQASPTITKASVDNLKASPRNSDNAEEGGFLPETDRLGFYDILYLKNQVRRTVSNEIQVDDAGWLRWGNIVDFYDDMGEMDDTDDDDDDDDDEMDEMTMEEYELFLISGDVDDVDETEDDGDDDELD